MSNRREIWERGDHLELAVAFLGEWAACRYCSIENQTENQCFGALSIQPKIPEISVGSSNGTDHFGLVRPEYSGPALKVVHCDRSGHFGRSDRNVPFHLPKLLSPVPLFSILLTRPSSFQWKVKCFE